MRILIIGSGAREHAMGRALARSATTPTIFCYSSSINPGLASIVEGYSTGELCTTEVITAAKNWDVDFAIIGPEAPLAAGVADALWDAGVPVIGPKKSLARIETSKAFTRQLMDEYSIPGCPLYKYFDSMSGVAEFLKKLSAGFVIKIDGLAGGKGVKVSGDHLLDVNAGIEFCQTLVDNGISFLIEEKLIGQEFSLMAFCDGCEVKFMPLVQDHKRLLMDDCGLNTGGMGSYTDANHSLPFLSNNDVVQAKSIFCACLTALEEKCQQNYHGILYGGFMATRSGVSVIEFNARFGDPEALNILAILQTDFAAICQAIVTGNLSTVDISFANLATVCKYAVPNGYPDRGKRDACVDVSQVKTLDNLYYGSLLSRDNKLFTGGSRAIAAVGVAGNLSQAEKIAEADINNIQGELNHRADIGTSKLIQSRVDFMHKLRCGELG